MAVAHITIGGDLTKLVAVLTASGLFASVTTASSQAVCTDADGHTVLKIGAASINFSAYIDASTAFTQSSGGYQLKTAHTCTNGVILEFANAGNYIAWVLLSKTNNGAVAVVYSPGTVPTGYSATAWGDDAVPATTGDMGFTARASYQTQFVPFITVPPGGSVSYTPNAFYMPYGNLFSSGNGSFIAGGKLYLTNGYWAILDGAAA